MAPEDYRGLNPLIYSHVNPYGRFELGLGAGWIFGIRLRINKVKINAGVSELDRDGMY